MKNNILTIRIHKSVADVFSFCITPPNSTLWIPAIVDEKTNEWPVKKGTIYTLQDNSGNISEVIVTTIKENEMIEWSSKDQTYHCRYTFKSVDKSTTELEYYEWVDRGELEGPFTSDVLKKLRSAIENNNS